MLFSMVIIPVDIPTNSVGGWNTFLSGNTGYVRDESSLWWVPWEEGLGVLPQVTCEVLL